MKFIGAAALTLAALLFANIETAEAQGYVGSGCNSCMGYGLARLALRVGPSSRPSVFRDSPTCLLQPRCTTNLRLQPIRIPRFGSHA